MTTHLQLNAAVMAAVRDHAARTYPEECCGLLVGKEHDAGRRHIVAAWALENVAVERHRGFKVAPKALLAAEMRARNAGLELLGVYHSHPDDAPRPSEADRRLAQSFLSYLIVNCSAGSSTLARCWRLSDDGKTFREEHWTEV